MLFTYWTGRPLTSPHSAEVWRARFPQFTVFEDKDVLPLLESVRFRELYSRITIPACKSDIARLVLLRKFGGLYIDSHAGPSNADRLFETIEILSSAELILFDRTHENAALGAIHPVINSAIASRRDAAILNLLIYSAFENLSGHARREAETSDHVAYNIFALTGAWDINVRLFDCAAQPCVVKPAFAAQVHVIKLLPDVDPGFQLYKYYQYRTPGDHWSERQTRERLFFDEPATI